MRQDGARSSVTRRRFLKACAGTGAAILAPMVAPSSALGLGGAVAPSDRIALGGIGIRHRGGYVLGFFLDQPDVRFAAIADVRADQRQAVKAAADRRYGNSDCAVYRDFRELLARDDIDAVLIATGDRWHALASILAARAGKDIYSEKPCAMTIGLARSLADAIRRHGRVFQAGTQRRTVGNFIHAVRLAQEGAIGRLHTLHASIYRLREDHSWLPAQPEPPKDVVDWDLWLGPAPWRPFNQRYVDGGWRGYFDFDSGATLLDWGAHTLDLCQWANQADSTTPVEFEPVESETDNVIAGRYANGVKVVLRSEGWLGLGTCPVRFEGDEGWVETGDTGRIAISPESLRPRSLSGVIAGTSPQYHVRDFLDCVKSRARPAANADIACYSHIACHAAYMAWKLRRKVTFDPVKEEFVGDDEANRMRTHAMREPWRV
ncbi:MAG: Gfo/Idh/MocA family oxidoreductase [Planctomycetes bacterium]|nr:Gfo/Idh/MocA family oxidoreductase [Planctomycetota bacterium]